MIVADNQDIFWPHYTLSKLHEIDLEYVIGFSSMERRTKTVGGAPPSYCREAMNARTVERADVRHNGRPKEVVLWRTDCGVSTKMTGRTSVCDKRRIGRRLQNEYETREWMDGAVQLVGKCAQKLSCPLMWLHVSLKNGNGRPTKALCKWKFGWDRDRKRADRIRTSNSYLQ